MIVFKNSNDFLLFANVSINMLVTRTKHSESPTGHRWISVAVIQNEKLINSFLCTNSMQFSSIVCL